MHERDLFHAGIDECSIRASLHSATFFEEGGVRHCLLSLSFQYAPGKESSLYSECTRFDFPASCSVLGWQFLDLARDTRFEEAFTDDLRREPTALDAEKWVEHGYKQLFTSQGDYSNYGRVFWGIGLGTSTFGLQAEGQLGTPPGLLEETPLCLLLQLKDAAPRGLSAQVSIKARVESSSSWKPAVYRFRHFSVKFRTVHLTAGPSLALIKGDRRLPRRSLSLAPNLSLFIAEHPPASASASAARLSESTSAAPPKSPSTLVVDFLESLPPERCAELFDAGEDALLAALERDRPALCRQGLLRAAISQSIAAMFALASSQGQDTRPPQVGSTRHGTPVVQLRPIRRSHTSPQPSRPTDSTGESPLDPGYMQARRPRIVKRVRTITGLRSLAKSQQ